MVRVVIRPWPRSSSRAATGVCVQGRASSAANRPRLVLLAGEYEPGAAFVQVVRVRTLRVESIGSDDRVGQIDSGRGEGVQQRGELGDLVALRADLDLAQHQRVRVGRGGE